MSTLHLGSSHPLAVLAASHCHEHVAPRVGGVACGACWERAMRDDERFALLNDMPRELVADPDLIDEVAVARAVSGEHLALTHAELRVAVAVLHERGRGPHAAAAVLGITARQAHALLDDDTSTANGRDHLAAVPA